ncbi:hypothetical protein GYA25_01875 [Candidatus Woesearchaeota archaeon]|nr:hypothetical protein [Candidatus Woesearchaeota archaeon]
MKSLIIKDKRGMDTMAFILVALILAALILISLSGGLQIVIGKLKSALGGPSNVDLIKGFCQLSCNLGFINDYCYKPRTLIDNFGNKFNNVTCYFLSRYKSSYEIDSCPKKVCSIEFNNNINSKEQFNQLQCTKNRLYLQSFIQNSEKEYTLLSKECSNFLEKPLIISKDELNLDPTLETYLNNYISYSINAEWTDKSNKDLLINAINIATGKGSSQYLPDLDLTPPKETIKFCYEPINSLNGLTGYAYLKSNSRLMDDVLEAYQINPNDFERCGVYYYFVDKTNVNYEGLLSKYNAYKSAENRGRDSDSFKENIINSFGCINKDYNNYLSLRYNQNNPTGKYIQFLDENNNLITLDFLCEPNIPSFEVDDVCKAYYDELVQKFSLDPDLENIETFDFCSKKIKLLDSSKNEICSGCTCFDSLKNLQEQDLVKRGYLNIEVKGVPISNLEIINSCKLESKT